MSITRLRETESLAKRHFAETALFGFLFLAVLFATPFIDSSLWWRAVAIGLVIWAIGYYRHRRRFRQFACPSCESPLFRSPAAAGEAVTFDCQLCDTVWDTTFRE